VAVDIWPTLISMKVSQVQAKTSYFSLQTICIKLTLRNADRTIWKMLVAKLCSALSKHSG
jgi:hypothetical protein